MICPFCHSDQLIVTNSRPTGGGLEIWRRRKCLKCRGVITTHEKIDLSCIVVIKRSGKRVKYNRAKLYSGIYHAIANTKKLDRGTAGDLAEKVMRDIEKNIVSLKVREIKSTEILKIVARVLKASYPDSCLRYLAYFSRREDLKKYIAVMK